MNPITRLIFEETEEGKPSSFRSFSTNLQKFGAHIEKIGPHHKFEYADEESFSVVFSSMGEQFISVSLSVRLPEDMDGWSGWSKETEMKRLEIQARWMKKHGIEENSVDPIRISNCFSPQDGSSSITVTKAYQGEEGNAC